MKTHLITTVILFLLSAVAQTRADEYYAAPDGLPTGTGSRSSPLDLATALTQTQLIRAGDVLTLRGGTYQGGFVCRLQGKPDRPVIVQQAVGERAIVNCFAAEGNTQFSIEGDWIEFRGFELTCKNPQRISLQAGSSPDDIRRGSITTRAAHVKFINLIIHDLANGIGFWSEGEDGEVYGCLIFANGWQGPDRAHGHGVYAQNQRGTKRIADNIIFNQFAYGIHCFGSDKAYLDGFEIEGNILFNNGALAAPPALNPNIFIGGGCPVSRTKISHNIALQRATCVRLGYPWGPANHDVTITDNYFVGDVAIKQFDPLVFQRNQVLGSNFIEYEEASTNKSLANDWDDNNYWQLSENQNPFMILEGGGSIRYTFEDWRVRTSADAHSKLQTGPPSKPHIFLRKNQYEPGRANIAVFNWTKAKSVEIDLSDVLKSGQQYRIVSAQNFFGEPIVRGVFTGKPVLLPMNPTEKLQPIGLVAPVPDTEPEFGAYVLLSQP